MLAYSLPEFQATYQKRTQETKSAEKVFWLLHNCNRGMIIT